MKMCSTMCVSLMAYFHSVEIHASVNMDYVDHTCCHLKTLIAAHWPSSIASIGLIDFTQNT